MRTLCAIFVVAAMVLSIAVMPASAGWKEKGGAYRAKLMDKPDSKAVCFIICPWAAINCRCCEEETDSDGDGVPDGIDMCANTPAGTKVDETGCPVEVKKFIDTGLISSTEILFDTDKATLKPESKAELDRIGAILAQVPDLKVEIGGHTDSQGADAYNMKLSEDRAKAVHDYLEANFDEIHGDNLVSRGYGETKPVATNDTAEGRAQNRRVEFVILK